MPSPGQVVQPETDEWRHRYDQPHHPEVTLLVAPDDGCPVGRGVRACHDFLLVRPLHSPTESAARHWVMAPNLGRFVCALSTNTGDYERCDYSGWVA